MLLKKSLGEETMFESLDDLESFVTSEEYKGTKRDIIIFNANLKMKRTFEDVLSLQKEINNYFKELREKDNRMYIVFSLNKKLLEDEIKSKLNS